jgi:phage-related protein
VADDPTIRIKVTTDTSQATSGLDQAAGKAESFGSRFKSTFTGVLAANVVQNLASKVFDFGKTSVEAYEKAEENTVKYNAALKKIPGASDLVTLSLIAQAKALANVTIYSAGQTKQAQATLAQFGLTGDQLKELTPLVQDYAAKTGQDLPTAASSIGKALLGQGRALKGVGIDFKNTKTLTGNYAEIVDGLKGKVGGLAEQMGGTSAGKMQIMQNKVTALKVQLGAALVPAIMKVSEVLAPLLEWVSKNTQWLVPLAMGVTAVAVAFKVLNGVLALFGANPSALLIMAIALAVVVLVVAIYELWTHWDTVWGWIAGKVDTVWQWIQTTWDTITGILQAPFLAFWDWIQGAWDAVLGIIRGVWDWVSANWPLLLGLLFGPIGLAIALIVTNWGKVTAAFGAALDWVKGVWNTVYNFVTTPIGNAVSWVKEKIDAIGGWFSSVAGAIGGAMSGVEDAITGPFKAAWSWIQNNVLSPLKSGWNTIANAVNSIHFSVDIPSWVPVVGGKGFDWSPPHVPTLAQGGLMTADGLVFAHAGEVISPAPASAAGRNGPAIVIERAEFREEVDVQAFLRSAAWEISTQRI